MNLNKIKFLYEFIVFNQYCQGIVVYECVEKLFYLYEVWSKKLVYLDMGILPYQIILQHSQWLTFIQVKSSY